MHRYLLKGFPFSQSQFEVDLRCVYAKLVSEPKIDHAIVVDSGTNLYPRSSLSKKLTKLNIPLSKPNTPLSKKPTISRNPSSRIHTHFQRSKTNSYVQPNLLPSPSCITLPDYIDDTHKGSSINKELNAD